MPTISQLPAASQVTAADKIPVSQGGAACSVSVGTLLAGTQPAILAATGTLLGRTSLGPGGPDPVEIGLGLLLNSDSLVATGADHATFPVQGSLTLSDEAVLNSGGNAKLLPLTLLRGLFSAGSNVAIDQYGTISTTLAGGTSGYSITNLPTVTTLSSADLVAVSQAGSDHTITYANFIDGVTVDRVQPAVAASDTDVFLVGQGENVMLRQTLSAMWTWLSSKLPAYLHPILELTTSTALTTAVHGGHVLICSQPITVTANAANMESGFACSLINLSEGSVSLSGDIAICSGNPTLAPGQTAALTCVTYSGGTVVYAWTSASPSSVAVPVQVTGLAVGSIASSSVVLTWTATSPSPTSYTVQYRISGAGAWSTVPSVTVPSCTVTGLLSATGYDFVVSAANSAGVGSASAMVSATTLAGLTAPGQVTGLTTSNPTTSSIALTWLPPGSGGAASSYSLQYRISGTTSWATGAAGLMATSFSATGLLSGTSYDFQVLASNGVGTGPASSVVTASTIAAGTSVSSVTWNLVPSGSYTHSGGAIGINAHIAPSTAPVQFGFATSPTSPPTSWTVGNYVNTDLWGAYVDTPAVAGTWYAWVEGTDGSLPTVYPTGFLVT